MQKTTTIIGQFKEATIINDSNRNYTLPHGITIILKDKTLNLQIYIHPSDGKNHNIGYYKIETKDT